MPYDEEDGPTAAELAYEQSLEDYKRQTGKTPKNADTSRHRSEEHQIGDRGPKTARGTTTAPTRTFEIQEPPGHPRCRSAVGQSKLGRAKTPDSPKAASAFFQQDRPGSSMSQAGVLRRNGGRRRRLASSWPPPILTLLYGPTGRLPKRTEPQIATLVDTGDDDSEDDDDQPGAPPIHVICRTPTGMTIPVNARPGWRCEAIVRRVGKAVGLESDVIRLVAGETTGCDAAC